MNALVQNHQPTLTRRQIFQGGGSMLVGFTVLAAGSEASAEEGLITPSGAKPLPVQAWIEVRADNTIVMRTGNSEFGQGTVYTAYRQIVAEELSTTVEAITTVITGDTDKTFDGGGSFALLGFTGTPNVRKASAYTYQAFLDLASERLRVPREKITVKDGVFSGGGKKVSYGDLVAGRELTLDIPVVFMGTMGTFIAGNPPMKPVSEYTVIGQSIDNSGTAIKVAAKETWVTDLRLPDMLHARIVRPPTLGSKLISAGAVDKELFPTVQLVVKGNLVAVVAPLEWDAIQAAQQVASETRWTEWKGLPGNAGLPAAMRQLDWTSTPVLKAEGGKEDIAPAMSGAKKTLKATYFTPYLKHVPIGPTISVADVRSDMTYVYTHTQNPQLLRQSIALMQGISPDNVVVRVMQGPGHYGRSNGGNAGSEDEAVILSKELGKPVRVQWMRAEDVQWSTQQSAAFSDIEIGLDANGKMVGYQADHFMPAMGDTRLVGAVLAGLPTTPQPSYTSKDFVKSTMNRLWDPWLYGATEFKEQGHGAKPVGLEESPISVGLRNHSMRTPGQFQQNFPREMAISEAAALAGADPLQFRIDHATDKRVVAVLEAVRDASKWQTRASPAAGATAKGDKVVRGRGVSLMLRQNTYWACVCEIAVTPATGAVKVEKVVVAADPGIIINPKQLKRQVEGGAVMGVSQALKEEVKFDESGVTSRDWLTYPILTMAEMPEIEVVLIDRRDVGVYGGGSEGANAIVAPAMTAALHDATGKIARHLPLSPEHVTKLMKT